jgi:hypothetical protein
MDGKLTTLLSAKLKVSKLTHPGEIAYLRYDDSFDALTLMLVSPSQSQETIVHYVDSNMGLLYDPETYEVVGFQIEAFEKSFVPMHANVGKAWKLSGDDLTSKDFGELTILIETLKPKIVKEVMAASQDAFQRFGLPAFSPSIESRQFAVV